MCGGDGDQALRKDLTYLTRHGYVTLVACAGQRWTDGRTTAVEAAVDTVLPPSIVYVSDTGDETWERYAGERGWHLKGQHRLDLRGLDPSRYGDLMRRYPAGLPLAVWQKPVVELQ